jgi:hypothetical protein
MLNETTSKGKISHENPIGMRFPYVFPMKFFYPKEAYILAFKVAQ